MQQTAAQKQQKAHSMTLLSAPQASSSESEADAQQTAAQKQQKSDLDMLALICESESKQPAGNEGAEMVRQRTVYGLVGRRGLMDG